MKTNIVILCAILSFSTFADVRPEADSDFIAQLKPSCMEVAEEDGKGE